MSGPRLRTFLVLAVLGAAVAWALGLLRGRSAPDVSHHPTLDGRPRPRVPVAGPHQAPLFEPVAVVVDLEVADQIWQAPVDGACPDGYPVKAKMRSGIYHLPGMMAYDRTGPDRCYPSAEAAAADGLRPAKR